MWTTPSHAKVIPYSVAYDSMHKYYHAIGMANHLINMPKMTPDVNVQTNEALYSLIQNFGMARRPIDKTSIWSNFWCRNQNFRKYMQMRKKHGIRPSETGFYHDKLYPQYVKDIKTFYNE